MNPSFVHLRVHSEYSIIDGIVRVKALTQKIAELGMPAVAVTDHVNLYALIKFYKAANASGVKPICGCDVLITEQDNPEQVSTLVLLVKNQTGYLHLTELISRAYLEGQYRGKPCIKRDWLKGNTEGLIALSGAKDGDIGQAILNNSLVDAENMIGAWMELFPDNFYMELQRTDRPSEELYLHEAVKLAQKLACPVVATNAVMFLEEEEFEAHETRVCINERRTLDDPRRPHNYSQKQYLRSSEEMQDLFSDIPEALDNTVEIAKRCNLQLVLDQPFLPNYPIPDGLTKEEFFRNESEEGLKHRLEELCDSSNSEFENISKPYF